MKKLSLIDLANTVKKNRAEKNITQEQLCEKTGINRNTIGRIERMDYIPTIPQLEKLAEVLNFDVDTFPILLSSYHKTPCISSWQM